MPSVKERIARDVDRAVRRGRNGLRYAAAVQRLTLATPVDFDALWASTALVREGRLEPDQLLDDTGNVPPDAVATGFKMLTPTADLVQYATLLQNLWNDEYVDGYQAMAQWAGDHVPFPAG